MGKICYTNKSLQFSEIAHKSLGKSITPSSPSVPLLFGFLFLSRAGTSLSFSLSFFLSSNQSSTGRPLAARARLDRRHGGARSGASPSGGRLQAWRGPVSGACVGRRAVRAQGSGLGLERAARCEGGAGGSTRGPRQARRNRASAGARAAGGSRRCAGRRCVERRAAQARVGWRRLGERRQNGACWSGRVAVAQATAGASAGEATAQE
jgi:hypothetical protein